MNKNLIILGTCNFSWDDIKNYKDYEIWSVAPILSYENLPVEIDVIFELHRKSEYKQDTIDLIYETTKPVYMQKMDKNVKNCFQFPFEEIFDKYGKYFTNSLSYLLAFAVLRKFENIGIFGVEMLSDRETTIEKSNLEYWIGYFRAKGINIFIQKDSMLCKTNHVYAIDDILKHRGYIEKRIDHLKKKLEEYQIVYYYKLSNSKKLKAKLNDRYFENLQDIQNKIDSLKLLIEENEFFLRTI